MPDVLVNEPAGSERVKRAHSSTNNSPNKEMSNTQAKKLRKVKKDGLIDKIRHLKPEDIEKIDLLLNLYESKKDRKEEENDEDMDEDEEDEENQDNLNNAIVEDDTNTKVVSDQQVTIDSAKVLALKKRYLELESDLDSIAFDLNQHGCYDEFFEQLKKSKTDGEFDSEQENVQKINQKQKTVEFKYTIRLRLNDTFFTNPKQIKLQIEQIKGNVNIENAFFNRYNKLLYLCTNDEDAFKQLSSPWPTNAFNKGVEIVHIVPKVERFFVAINGVDTSIDIENDVDFKMICTNSGILRTDRIIKKQKGTPLSTIKAQVIDKESYEKLIKFGIKYDSFSYRVSKWRFDAFQPVQCYKCQKYGHNQKVCSSNTQKCLFCSGEHRFKDCPKKDPIKCCNCGGPHAACYKLCPANKKATLAKQKQMYERGYSKVDPSFSYSNALDQNNKQNQAIPTQINNNNSSNNMLAQFIQVLSQLLVAISNPNPNNDLSKNIQNAFNSNNTQYV